MRNARKPKKTDHENVDKIIKLIIELKKLNPKFDECLWYSAFMYGLASGYNNSGFTYDEFRADMDEAFKHYKDIFNG